MCTYKKKLSQEHFKYDVEIWIIVAYNLLVDIDVPFLRNLSQPNLKISNELFFLINFFYDNFV